MANNIDLEVGDNVYWLLFFVMLFSCIATIAVVVTRMHNKNIEAYLSAGCNMQHVLGKTNQQWVCPKLESVK